MQRSRVWHLCNMVSLAPFECTSHNIDLYFRFGTIRQLRAATNKAIANSGNLYISFPAIKVNYSVYTLHFTLDLTKPKHTVLHLSYFQFRFNIFVSFWASRMCHTTLIPLHRGNNSGGAPLT